MFDPDDIPDTAEGKALDSLLADLDGCDLGDWDRTFVDDLLYKLKKLTISQLADLLSARQRTQLNRMKEQYDVSRKSKNYEF